MQQQEQEYDVVVIGTGFGGTLTTLTIAEKLKNKEKKPKMLMLERGTWWTTPVPTVQDKAVATFDFLKNKHHQPVQYWNSVDHIKGLIDLVLRCFRRSDNPDGLLELTQLGKRGFLGLGRKNDGVTVLRACGVGGGSLVYSNITTPPPDFIFDDPRWQALKWSPEERKGYYDLARDAIGFGVVAAWRKKVGDPDPDVKKVTVNAGLSNISTRSARINPDWKIVNGIKRIRFPDTNDPTKETPDKDLRALSPNDLQLRSLKQNRYWIDRARVFQTAMLTLTNDFGVVDSSINDITPEGTPLNPLTPTNPINYCERQGRCNVGCLPGARHTLNKQLMAAIFGKFDNTPALFSNLQLQALAEVDIIRALPDNAGYEVEYWQRDEKNPSNKTAIKVKAKRVIVAAGCLGTNEILLRSKERGGLPHLSSKLGAGFSTNGDYIAFLEGLEVKDKDTNLVEKMAVSLTRGPVTTSFGHFNTPEAKLNSKDKVDTAKFHIIEDQGVPKVLASTAGFGVPFARKLMAELQNWPRVFVLWLVVLWLWNKTFSLIKALLNTASERQDIFKSEDELTNNMMCIVSQGREASVGQFRLGKDSGETPLRVARTDGLSFIQDPIFTEIRSSLDRLALALGSKNKFINPLVGNVAEALKAESIATSHPLGGCAIGNSVADGVVDEFGHVFCETGTGAAPGYYDGLYVVDASILPTALGVNPSLTISALALRIAENIAKDM